MDAFFAASADVHGLTLVTRNLRDFVRLGVPLFDPWAAPPRHRDRAAGRSAVRPAGRRSGRERLWCTPGSHESHLPSGDAGGDRHTKTCHRMDHGTAHPGLALLPRQTPGAQAPADQRLVAEHRGLAALTPLGFGQGVAAGPGDPLPADPAARGDGLEVAVAPSGPLVGLVTELGGSARRDYHVGVGSPLRYGKVTPGRHRRRHRRSPCQWCRRLSRAKARPASGHLYPCRSVRTPGSHGCRDRPPEAACASPAGLSRQACRGAIRRRHAPLGPCCQ